jgi:hypothetical protein
MTDLHTRFRTLDDLPAPDLWHEIEARAVATQQGRVRPLAWAVIAVVLLLVLAIGGAALIGSGIIKLPVVPVLPESSATPSSTPQVSPSASSTPVAQAAAWTATGSMVEARSGQTATLLSDGKVLVAGGGGTDLASAELYDPSSGTWTATGSMVEARAAYAATLLPDGKVLVAGGSSGAVGDAPPPGLVSAELYDPDTGTWTATGSMDEAHCSPTATLLGTGKVLVAGGINCSSYDALATAELYDPGSGTWSAAEGMVEARSGHTATLLLNGNVLVAGSGSGSLASAELYDPTSGQWTATGAMLEGRISHTATLLLEGKVLVAGSMSGTGASPSAELYDPSTGQWSATGAMHESRLGHTATLLPGGRVLVAGGTNSVIDGGQASASAELYDPATGSWTATAGMLEAFGHTATLLGDGTVLVTGGGAGGSGPLASAELYDPGTGT